MGAAEPTMSLFGNKEGNKLELGQDGCGARLAQLLHRIFLPAIQGGGNALRWSSESTVQY